MTSARWHAVLKAMACAAAMFIGSARAFDVAEQSLSVPVADLAGHHQIMKGWICRPPGVEKPKLVVINHGSTTLARDRPYMPLANCHNEAVRWFLDRHYAVVQAWRLGYGGTGGPWSEDIGNCSIAGYYKAGMETAREIGAIVQYAIGLPGIDPNDVVVVGHSGGGWGVMAYNALPHPHVSAIINMAGGRGGHYHNQPNSNCRDEHLIAAVRLFAKHATTRMLWIYANNDSYFGPALASEMEGAYVAAGGKLESHETASHGSEGHTMFFDDGGVQIWGPLVQAYLEGAPSSRSNQGGR